jgi:hypothetical protein
MRLPTNILRRPTILSSRSGIHTANYFALFDWDVARHHEVLSFLKKHPRLKLLATWEVICDHFESIMKTHAFPPFGCAIQVLVFAHIRAGAPEPDLVAQIVWISAEAQMTIRRGRMSLHVPGIRSVHRNAVFLDGAGHDFFVQLALIRQGLECGNSDVMTIDFEEVAQGRA